MTEVKFTKPSKFFFLIFITVFLFSIIFLVINQIKTSKEIRSKAAGEGASFKKGVAGGATSRTLSQIKSSWFYNWGYIPGYKPESSYNNWDPEVWKKFVPMFTPWQSKSTTFPSVDKRMNEICQKTAYCYRGNYYLIGNEPDNPTIGEQDRLGATLELAAYNAVVRYGDIAKRILNKDKSAKLIIIGFTYRNDQFADFFLSKWKDYWKNDPQIAILPRTIKGWHLHVYGNYQDCPLNDSYVRGAAQYLSNRTTVIFGEDIKNMEIWVTEMGTLNNLPPFYPPSEKRNKFLQRMRCLVSIFESSTVVNRYAWFYHGCNPSVHLYSGCDNVKWAGYNLFYPPDQYCRENFCLSDLGKVYATLATGGQYPSPSPIPTSPPLPTATLTPQLTKKPTPIFTLTPTLKPTKMPLPTATFNPWPSLTPIPLSPTSTPKIPLTLIPSLTVTPTNIPGDVNHDNHVNAVDYGIFVSKYNTFDPDCDFTKNGRVDAGDYSILVENYGKY